MYFWLCKLKDWITYFTKAPFTYNLCAVFSCNWKKEKRIWENELKPQILNSRNKRLESP